MEVNRLTVPPPAAGAIVMATGIESVILHTAGERALSAVLLWLAVAAWLSLGGLVAAALVRHREVVRARAASPAALTAVAGTAVLGTRMVVAGWTAAGAVSLVLASVLWLGLQRPVWRSWRTPVSGAAFMVTVSAEALAVLCAVLAASWPAHGLEIASAVALGAAAAWLPLLVAAEVRRPRIEYDLRRWATVFPVAMYSAVGSAVAGLTGPSALGTVSHWWTWVAFAVWVAVSAAMLRPALSKLKQTLRAGPARSTAG